MSFETRKHKLKLDKRLAFKKEKIKEFVKKTNKIQINIKTNKGKIIASFPLNIGIVFLVFAPILIGLCASFVFILNYEIELEK